MLIGLYTVRDELTTLFKNFIGSPILPEKQIIVLSCLIQMDSLHRSGVFFNLREPGFILYCKLHHL